MSAGEDLVTRRLFSLVVGLVLLPFGILEASHTNWLFDPAQFRQHAEERYFHIYWNYTRPGPDLIEARGYVTAKAQSPDFETVTLELVGLNGTGESVSRGLGVTRGGKIAWGESRPFAIRLRLTGREQAFSLRTWHLQYHH